MPIDVSILRMKIQDIRSQAEEIIDPDEQESIVAAVSSLESYVDLNS
jgi:hypothetical protein